MEAKILAYIQETKPSEMNLERWVSKTFCLPFREAVQVVERLQGGGTIQIRTGMVT